MSLAETHRNLDEEDVRRVVEELGLDMAKLPGSQDTETEKYRHGSKLLSYCYYVLVGTIW